MKILLIDPTSIHQGPPPNIKNSDNEIQKMYNSRINEEVSNFLNIDKKNVNAMSAKYVSNYGLLMLSKILKDNGFEVDYINGDYFSSQLNFLEHITLNVSNYDIVCLTGTTPQFCETKTIAEAIKKTNPNIKIILGGVHSKYYETNELDECFDSVCIGYGLDQSLEVIKSISLGNKFLRKNISNHYFDYEKDFEAIPKDKINSTLLYSYINFGCNNSCNYCIEHKLIKGVCINDFETKLKEIEKLTNEYGAKFIHLADSDFLMSKKTVEKFIEYIKGKKIKICFSFNTTPTLLIKYKNSDLFSRLKEIGLIEILIGIEHFSPQVQEKMNKEYNIDDFIESLYNLKYKSEIPIISLYSMVGLPFEYESDIKTNVEMLKKLYQYGLYDFSFPKFFVPYPETDIYNNPQGFDVEIKNKNWDQYHRWQLPRPIIIKEMSDKDYVNEIDQIHNIILTKR